MAGHASASVLFFDGFWLDRQGGGLFQIDQGGCLIPVALGSRGLELLDFLARRGGEPVSKDEIMTIVWSGRVVEEANLNVQISKLRHILDRDRPWGSCIQTINGFGYRFVAEVKFLDRSALSPFRQTAENASPTAVNSGGAVCSRGRASQDESGTTAGDKVVRLGLPERLPHPAENEPYGARTARSADAEPFLISRLRAAGIVDPDLTAVLMELQQRLIDDYGEGAAARTLIDQVVAAYQDFIRLTGWIAHLSLTVEHELFRGEGGSTLADSVHANRTWIDGPSAEQRLVQLREFLLPMVERRGALMREMLSALEIFQPGSCRKTTAVLEPMRAEFDQLSRRQRVISSMGEIGGAQACDADFC